MRLNKRAHIFLKKLTTLGVIGSLLFGFVFPPIASAHSIDRETKAVEEQRSKPEDFKLRKALQSMYQDEGKKEVEILAQQYVNPQNLPLIMEEYRARYEEAKSAAAMNKESQSRGNSTGRSARKYQILRMLSGKTVKVVGNWKRFTVRLGQESIPFWAAVHKGLATSLAKMVWEKRNEFAELGISVEDIFWETYVGDVDETRKNWEGRIDLFFKYQFSDSYSIDIQLARFLDRILDVYFPKVEVNTLNSDQQHVIDDVKELFRENLDPKHGVFGRLNIDHVVGLKNVNARVFRGNHLFKDKNTYIVAPMRTDYIEKASRYNPSSRNIVHGDLWMHEELVDKLAELKNKNVDAYREMLRAIVLRELMLRAISYMGASVFADFDSDHHIIDNAHTQASQNVMIKAIINHLHFSSDWAISYVKSFPDQRNLLKFVESLPSIKRLKKPINMYDLKNDMRYFILFLLESKPFRRAWNWIKKHLSALGGGVGVVALFLHTSFNTNISPADAFNGTGSASEFSIVPWIITVIIGSVWYYISHRTQQSENLLLATTGNGTAQLQSDFLKISNPLSETAVVNSLFSLSQRVAGNIEDPGIRFVNNIKDLMENPDKVAKFLSFVEEANKEGDQALPYEIAIAAENVDEARAFLKKHGLLNSHVRVLYHPFENGVYDLMSFVEKPENKLTGDGYALRVINNRYWSILEELKKNIPMVDGFMEMFDLDLKGKISAEQAA